MPRGRVEGVVSVMTDSSLSSWVTMAIDVIESRRRPDSDRVWIATDYQVPFFIAAPVPGISMRQSFHVSVRSECPSDRYQLSLTPLGPYYDGAWTILTGELRVNGLTLPTTSGAFWVGYSTVPTCLLDFWDQPRDLVVSVALRAVVPPTVKQVTDTSQHTPLRATEGSRS